MGLIYFVQESRLVVPAVMRRDRITMKPAAPGSRGLIKIGHTNKPLASRLISLSTAVQRNISLIGSVEGTCTDECALHRDFTPHRANVGWGLEWYYPVPAMREAIVKILASTSTRPIPFAASG